jgi:hypothetical protein
VIALRFNDSVPSATIANGKERKARAMGCSICAISGRLDGRLEAASMSVPPYDCPRATTPTYSHMAHSPFTSAAADRIEQPGRQTFRTHDESRDNVIVGVLALGEGWHNSHHAFPTSARHGLGRWQIDVSYIVIRLMGLVGLARDIRLPSAERMAAKRAE